MKIVLIALGLLTATQGESPNWWPAGEYQCTTDADCEAYWGLPECEDDEDPEEYHCEVLNDE